LHTKKKEHQQNYKATLPNLQQVAPCVTRANICKCFLHEAMGQKWQLL